MVLTQTEVILILNRNNIINSKLFDIEGLKFNIVLWMYLPKMWDNDFNYQHTLYEANHYYEPSSYEAKKDPNEEKTQVSKLWIFST
jgi:hypothetical protein